MIRNMINFYDTSSHLKLAIYKLDIERINMVTSRKRKRMIALELTHFIHTTVIRYVQK